jgi:hypothetical protein
MSWEAWGDPPDPICEMCGRECGSCICESCPECGEAGSPKCYEIHGMVETEEQIQSRIQHAPDDYFPSEWY